MHLRFLYGLLIGGLFACGPRPAPPAAQHLSPELQKALASFELADDFEIELYAAEPLIADPVAMEVDENGTVYVVEMHGYPLDKSGTGKVKILTDTDHDGYPDASQVFADSLVLPTGIMRWQKGVIVTDPPNVLYLEDTTGDGKADIRKVLLTGFALSNPQHNLNSPIFGLDNWIYLAHESSITPNVYKKEFGDEGTKIHFPDRPAATLPKNANGRNVRFKPGTYELEMLAGETQFGQTFDAYGHHILTSNAHHLFHEAIADRYLRRNPGLLVADATQSMPDHGDACEVYPITQNPEHQLLTDVGVITSSCGVTWYLGGLFPEKYKDMTVIAEPVHNLVHADFIKDNGASFVASRVFEKKEFLASKDAWFRPVNFYVGPDGALYVIDYYRQIVEHPEWMADETNQSGKLYNGTDQGRIYRIKPKGTTLAKFVGLGKATDETLVNQLKSANIWFRRTAQRLLLDRQSPATLPLLRDLIKADQSPESVVHALWTLHGLGAIAQAPELLKRALAHANAGVRENAIKIVEVAFINQPDTAQQAVWLAQLIELAQRDPSPKVRFQLLCTLGFGAGTDVLAARNELLLKDIEDKWVQYAALSAAQGKEMEVFDFAVQQLASQPSTGKSLFFANVSALIGLGQDPALIGQLIHKVAQDRGGENAWWQAASLAGLGKTLAYMDLDGALATEKGLLLGNLAADKAPELQKASLALLEVIGLPGEVALRPAVARALAVLGDQRADDQARSMAIGLLALHQPDQYAAQIQQLITPQSSSDLQKVAMQALNKTKGTQVCGFLLKEWPNFTPEIKEEAVAVLMENRERTQFLLAALADKKIPSSAVAWPNQVRLMNNDDLAIRQKARILLASHAPEKTAILAQYQPALLENGDVANGLAVFHAQCAQCHQMNGQLGKAIGPDLGTLRNRQPLSIALEVLVPSNSIADGYEFWTVERKSGGISYGIISAETATSITLRDLAGAETTIPRKEIAKLAASNTSIMPGGFAQSIDPKAMADLVGFIKNYRE